MRSRWNTGFTADVVVANTGTGPIDGWVLEWDLTAGQKVTQGWSGQWTQTGAHVTVRDLDRNRVIPAGGSIAIGFTGSHTGDNPRRNGSPSTARPAPTPRDSAATLGEPWDVPGRRTSSPAATPFADRHARPPRCGHRRGPGRTLPSPGWNPAAGRSTAPVDSAC